jgi:hypothetical protein
MAQITIYHVLKSFLVISRVNVELKTNVSGIFFVSISIRGDVVNGRISLKFIPVCQIDASSYWCTMQQEGGVNLCGHPSDSELSPLCLT